MRNITINLIKEIRALLEIESFTPKAWESTEFYLSRFQSKAMLTGNFLTFFMYIIFAPFIINALRTEIYPIPNEIYLTTMGISFIIMNYLAYFFYRRFYSFKFDKIFKSTLVFNIFLIVLINYFSAYILQYYNTNLAIMVFSVAYVNICLVLSTRFRVIFNLINVVVLVATYILLQTHIGQAQYYEIALIVLVDFFFLVLGQIFYKMYIITVLKHIDQNKKLDQINAQKNLIEEVLQKQQEAIRQLQLSLNNESNLETIFENPLQLSQKINSLIGELDQSKKKLQLSKEKYKDIFDNVSDGIMIRNKELEVTISNPKIEEITGFKLGKDKMKRLDNLIKSDFKESYEEYISQLKQGKEAYFKGEITTNRQLGVSEIEVHSTPIMEKGEFMGARDIVRKFTKEQQRILQNHEKYEAERLFLLHLNHEIRTPLNSIVGFTDLLSKSDLPPAEKEMITVVNHSSVYLKNLVNDILELVQLEKGHYETQIQSYSFRKENLKILQNFEYLVQDKEVELQFECHLDENEIFEFDLRLYTKLLNNLLSNALKYTEKGFVKLTISVQLDQSNHQSYAHITLEDTGIGIAQEHRQSIFEKFKQYNTTENKIHQGIGIGLSICKEIIQQLNGEISIDSTVGKGTTFSISYPITPISTFKHLKNEDFQNTYRRR